jgi:hypothetical protein
MRFSSTILLSLGLVAVQCASRDGSSNDVSIQRSKFGALEVLKTLESGFYKDIYLPKKHILDD